MSYFQRLGWVALGASAVLALAGACGTGSQEAPPLPATEGGPGGDGTIGFELDGGEQQAKALEIDPADSTVTVTDLATPQSATLTAKATFADNSKRAVAAS